MKISLALPATYIKKHLKWAALSTLDRESGYTWFDPKEKTERFRFLPGRTELIIKLKLLFGRNCKSLSVEASKKYNHGDGV